MYQLIIGKRKPRFHTTLAQCIAQHDLARDLSGKGASAWPPCSVITPDLRVLTVSYNGRVWDKNGVEVLS